MEPTTEEEQVTAKALIAFAQQRGIDLNPLRGIGVFQKNERWMVFERQKSDLDEDASVSEEIGPIHYVIRGDIPSVPTKYRDSTELFPVHWAEAGSVENFEQALALLEAWLQNQMHVDNLP